MNTNLRNSVNNSKMGQKTRIYHHNCRDPLSLYPAWLCRLYIWFYKSKSLVVNTAHANYFPFFGNGIRDIYGNADLYGDQSFP